MATPKKDPRLDAKTLVWKFFRDGLGYEMAATVPPRSLARRSIDTAPLRVTLNGLEVLIISVPLNSRQNHLVDFIVPQADFPRLGGCKVVITTQEEKDGKMKGEATLDRRALPAPEFAVGDGKVFQLKLAWDFVYKHTSYIVTYSLSENHAKARISLNGFLLLENKLSRMKAFKFWGDRYETMVREPGLGEAMGVHIRLDIQLKGESRENWLLLGTCHINAIPLTSRPRLQRSAELPKILSLRQPMPQDAEDCAFVMPARVEDLQLAAAFQEDLPASPSAQMSPTAASAASPSFAAPQPGREHMHRSFSEASNMSTSSGYSPPQPSSECSPPPSKSTRTASLRLARAASSSSGAVSPPAGHRAFSPSLGMRRSLSGASQRHGSGGMLRSFSELSVASGTSFATSMNEEVMEALTAEALAEGAEKSPHSSAATSVASAGHLNTAELIREEVRRELFKQTEGKDGGGQQAAEALAREVEAAREAYLALLQEQLLAVDHHTKAAGQEGMAGVAEEGTAANDMEVAWRAALEAGHRSFQARLQAMEAQKEALHARLRALEMQAAVAAGGSPKARDAPAQTYTCPLTQAVMRDPVMAADGFTYERAAISAWLAHHGTSPITSHPLPHQTLLPNHLARSELAPTKPAETRAQAAPA